MRIVYPYNEILPKKTAHDVFIFDECAALAASGCDVTLLCGKGSLLDEDLFRHYHVPQKAFHIVKLPIIRKNNPLGISWNAPFFFLSQKTLKQLMPDWVFLSVRKQGAYHLRRKIPGVRYVYEIHEVAFYPHSKSHSNEFTNEKDMLNQADLITVTTEALKQILIAPPYALSVPIEVLPLGVKNEPLPPPPEKDNPLILMYIGQLYTGQGVENLINATALIENVHVKIVGGKGKDILRLQKLAASLGILDKIEFLGFVPPAELSEYARNAHAFIAPFDRSGRMPYVAHTKLYEYARWGRPIVAPDLPVVREHFSGKKGALLFEPENNNALADCICMLKERPIRDQLQQDISQYADHFTWKARAARYREYL